MNPGRFKTDAGGRFVSKRRAGRVIDPNRRASWSWSKHGTPQLPPGAPALHDLQAGVSRPTFEIYAPDDEHIDSDVQFGVTRALIGNFVVHDKPAPELGFAAPWYSLEQRFVVEPGEARRPRAPIRSKAPAYRE
jgi:catechol 1,2-dioxygenase